MYKRTRNLIIINIILVAGKRYSVARYCHSSFQVPGTRLHNSRSVEFNNSLILIGGQKPSGDEGKKKKKKKVERIFFFLPLVKSLSLSLLSPFSFFRFLKKALLLGN